MDPLTHNHPIKPESSTNIFDDLCLVILVAFNTE